MLFFIKAKFKGVCTETGASVKKGDRILFDTKSKKVYTSTSPKYVEEYSKRQEEIRNTSESCYVQAQEVAYFDTFCLTNNI